MVTVIDGSFQTSGIEQVVEFLKREKVVGLDIETSRKFKRGTYKEDIQNPTFNQDAMMDAMIDAILGKTTFNNYSSDPIGKELTALGLAKGFSTGQQAGQVNYLDPQTIASIDALLGISGYSKVPLF